MNLQNPTLATPQLGRITDTANIIHRHGNNFYLICVMVFNQFNVKIPLSIRLIKYDIFPKYSYFIFFLNLNKAFSVGSSL